MTIKQTAKDIEALSPANALRLAGDLLDEAKQNPDRAIAYYRIVSTIVRRIDGEMESVRVFGRPK